MNCSLFNVVCWRPVIPSNQSFVIMLSELSSVLFNVVDWRSMPWVRQGVYSIFNLRGETPLRWNVWNLGCMSAIQWLPWFPYDTSRKSKRLRHWALLSVPSCTLAIMTVRELIIIMITRHLSTSKLRLVQNSIARIVTGMRRYEHITPVLVPAWGDMNTLHLYLLGFTGSR